MSEVIKQDSGENWAAFNGDSCEVIKGIPDASIDFSVFSPPFANLYIYSDSMADMGNCENMDEFIEHYKFLTAELHRVTVMGRLCAVHCKDLPLYFNRDGEAGLVDFPGKLIEAHCGTEAAEYHRTLKLIDARIRSAIEKQDEARAEKMADARQRIVDDFYSSPPADEAWTFHSRVAIWKCPVTERERTNNHGLLHKTVCNDSSAIRQGMADYVLVFRKVGEKLLSDKPIVRPKGFTRYVGDPECDPRTSDFHPSKYARHRKSTTADIAIQCGDPNDDAPPYGNPAEEMVERKKGRRLTASIDVWRRYAEPVWWDIDQTDVLNFKLGRDSSDERHICPLQLGVIRRCVELWTNPGDTVLTPFLGVGSEGYVALQEGRKAIGIELKESYFDLACRHMRQAETEFKRKERSLFTEAAT